MNVRFVREIEQVVDQQARAGFERRATRCAPPLARPRHVRNLGRVGECGIARKDPDLTELLDQRTTAHVGRERDLNLGRRTQTCAVGIEAETVIAALQYVAVELSGRK